MIGLSNDEMIFMNTYDAAPSDVIKTVPGITPNVATQAAGQTPASASAFATAPASAFAAGLPECETIITIYKNDFRYCGYTVAELSKVDLAPFAPLTEREIVAPGDLLFLDTETTGLSGGPGTVAFMLGVGHFCEAGFIVKQYLMRDYDEEESQLGNLTAEMGGRKTLVTYNGKAFDMNLLAGRYIMNGLRMPNSSRHIDLLHPARRAWRRCIENCRLTTVENLILGERRADDIPGSMIPQVFFDFLETHEYTAMQQVLSHNRMDILALAAILKYLSDLADRVRRGEPYQTADSAIAGKLSAGKLADRIAEELLGVAGFFYKLDEAELAVKCLHASLEREKPSVTRRALFTLAEIHKRGGEYEKAAQYWKRLLAYSPNIGIYPYVELAKYYEHKARDPQTARVYADQALALACGPVFRDSRVRLELEARRARLCRKISRLSMKNA